MKERTERNEQPWRVFYVTSEQQLKKKATDTYAVALPHHNSLLLPHTLVSRPTAR